MPHPPIDPEIAAALALDGGSASLRPDEIPAARRRIRTNERTRTDLTADGTLAVTDLSIPSADGGTERPALVLRAITTTAATSTNTATTANTVARSTPDAAHAAHTSHGADRTPGIMFIHGGGMVMGTEWNIDEAMIDAARRGATVISVSYRLAPEDPFPAGPDDCFAAWTWIARHAADLAIDPARLAIAGTSAGGGLAAATTLRARDTGVLLPCAAILFCPMLDDRQITASASELDGVGRWDRTANATGWSAFLAGRADDDVPAYAAPARADDLHGLPPTFIDVGTVDTFRDEDIDFAARLARAGVQTELHLWPGATHGFTGTAPDAAISRAAARARRDFLQRYLLRG